MEILNLKLNLQDIINEQANLRHYVRKKIANRANPLYKTL